MLRISSYTGGQVLGKEETENLTSSFDVKKKFQKFEKFEKFFFFSLISHQKLKRSIFIEKLITKKIEDDRWFVWAIILSKS